MSTSNAGNQNGTPTAEQLEREIAEQRDHLADTVDALQAKLDVKTRARDKATDLKDRATTDSGNPRPPVVAGAVLVLVAVGALVYLRRNR